MERLNDPSLSVLSAIGVATLFVLYFLLRKDDEAPVPYQVTPPEQVRPGWKGEVLEEPNLKVCSTRTASSAEIDMCRSLAPH